MTFKQSGILKIGFLLTLMSLGSGIDAFCQKEKKGKQAEAVIPKNKQEMEAEFIDATSEKILGNFKTAHTLFAAFVKNYPEIAAGHYEYGELSALNGIYSQAVPAFEKAVEIEPANKWYRVRLAEMYDFLKMYKESKAQYMKLAELYPKELEFALSAASIWVEEGKLSEAIQLLDKIELQIGVTEEINLEKYRLYMAQKKFPEALKELEKLQTVYPRNTVFLGMSAEVYQAKGDKKKAMEIYQQILQNDSSNTLIHLALADYFQKEKDLEKSFFYLEKAFQNKEVDIDQKIMILLSFLDQSKASETHKKQGEKLTRLLTEIHPESAKSWSISGDYALSSSNWREALASFNKVLSLEQSKFIFFRQTAQLAIRVEDYASLKKTVDAAEELFPVQPEVFLYKGILLMNTGKLSDAEEALNYGKELVIENPILSADFMAMLGKLSGLKNDFSKADEYFKKANSISNLSYISTLEYARFLSSRKQNPETALSLAEQSIKLAPDYPETYAAKAYVLFNQDKVSESAAIIEMAMNKGGNQIKSELLLYAQILEKTGNSTKAAEIKKQAELIP